MASPFTPEETGIIRRHQKDCAGYVVAASGDCFTVQTQETWGPQGRVPGRRFRPLHPDDLAKIRLRESWFMGILLCPGDPIDGILDWYAALPRLEHARVKFYVHPKFDGATADARFQRAKAHPERVARFAGSWQNFHRLFGLDHGRQVVTDCRNGILSSA